MLMLPLPRVGLPALMIDATPRATLPFSDVYFRADIRRRHTTLFFSLLC